MDLASVSKEKINAWNNQACTYNQLKGNMVSLLVPLNPMHQIAPHDLENDKHIDCQSNAMVRIRQAPFRPDSKPAEHKHNGAYKQSQNLAPHMQFEGPVWIPSRIVSYD